MRDSPTLAAGPIGCCCPRLEGVDALPWPEPERVGTLRRQGPRGAGPDAAERGRNAHKRRLGVAGRGRRRTVREAAPRTGRHAKGVRRRRGRLPVVPSGSPVSIGQDACLSTEGVGPGGAGHLSPGFQVPDGGLRKRGQSAQAPASARKSGLKFGGSLSPPAVVCADHVATQHRGRPPMG